MASFEQGSIIRVPFPYTDRPVRQHRPALVISDGGTGDQNALLWVLMITSAENRPWPGDVPFGEGYAAAGLPVRSVVRTSKIATIEARHAQRIGSMEPATLLEVVAGVRATLGL